MMEFAFSMLWGSFVSVFVAMNVLTTAPIYLGLTAGMDDTQRPRLIRQAIVLAAAVALGIALLGGSFLQMVGVELVDLRMAGGLILFGLGFHDLVLSRGKRMALTPEDIGAVPIGVPLVVGPATMTTIMVIAEKAGHGLAIFALLSNLSIAWIVLRFAHRIVPLIGVDGARAFGKLMSLMLAAIGIAMVRGALGALTT